MKKRFLAFVFLLFLQSLFSDGDDWPKWRGSKGNGTWAGPPIMKELPAGGLKKNWQLKVSPGYSGVTVADGLAYLMDKPKPQRKGEVERVLCINIEHGEVLWEYSYEVNYAKLDYGTGPRASVTVHKEKAYGLGAMGHAFCLDAKNGKLIFDNNKNYLILFDGSFIDIDNKKITTFSFKKTEFDLSKHKTKTTVFPKIQEIDTWNIFLCLSNLYFLGIVL